MATSIPHSTLAGRAVGPDDAAPYLSPAGALLALGAAVLLCWPMLATSAPLVYFDSVSYFTNGEELWRRALAMLGLGAASAGSAMEQAGATAASGDATIRSLAYAMFFYPAALTPLGLVLVCVLQTAMTLFVFLGLVPPLTGSERRLALAGFAAVATLSTLPWFASYAMPDILGAVLPAYFALALRRADGFGSVGRSALMAIATFAILSHYGHLPLAFVLAVAAIAWRALRGRLTGAALAFCALPVVAAFAFNLAVSIAIGMLGVAAAQSPGAEDPKTEANEPVGGETGTSGMALAIHPAPPATTSPAAASLAPNRVPVLLARSIEDGPGRWYLEEECRTFDRYAICEVFDEMPDNVWAILWAGDGLRTATPEQMTRIRAEETEIVLAAARRYPVEQAAALVRNTLYQTVLVGTGEVLPLPEAAAGTQLAELAPRTIDNETDPVLQAFDWISPVFTLLAFLVLGWRIVTRRTEHVLVEAVLMIGFALLVNAAIFGGLSAPVDRYQSRLAWLIPALLALDIAIRPRGSPDQAETRSGG